MAKIKLDADPSFKATVSIPIPGADNADVLFTFKHRTRDECVKWLEGITKKKDSQVVTEMATAWDLDDEFNAKNAERLCQNYGGAGSAIFDCYLRELRGARAKN